MPETAVSPAWADDAPLTSDEKLQVKIAAADLCSDAWVAVNRKLLIIDANSRIVDLSGYSRGELIGQPVRFLVPEGLRDLHDHHTAEYIGAPVSRPMGLSRDGTPLDTKLQRRDGFTVPVSIRLERAEVGRHVIVTAFLRKR